MSKLKILTAREMEKVLFFMGFEKIRQSGSHVFYKHSDGRAASVPHHKGQTLARPLLRAILRDVDLSLEQFNYLLENKI